MTELRTFCEQLSAFVDDLCETYPEEPDISTAAQKLRLLKQVNPRIIHSVFMTSVYSEYAQHILDENEDYILTSIKSRGDNLALWVFDKHWNTMAETNKQIVWKYIKTLVLLAARVPVL
jgi:hypothetical protein